MSLFYYINLVKHKKLWFFKIVGVSYNLEGREYFSTYINITYYIILSKVAWYSKWRCILSQNIWWSFRWCRNLHWYFCTHAHTDQFQKFHVVWQIVYFLHLVVVVPTLCWSLCHTWKVSSTLLGPNILFIIKIQGLT